LCVVWKGKKKEQKRKIDTMPPPHSLRRVFLLELVTAVAHDNREECMG
jgi:hypothetical protein